MKILEYKNKNYFPFSSISFVHTHTSQKETDDRLSVLVLFLKIHLVLDRKVFEESQSPQRFIYSRQTFLMLISRSFPPKKKNVGGGYILGVVGTQEPQESRGRKN
jgi:hypothetical protein